MNPTVVIPHRYRSLLGKSQEEKRIAISRLNSGRPNQNQPFQFAGISLRWVESDQAEVIGVARRTCEKISPGIRHTGWFLDNDIQDETATGVVFTLTHRRGFVPAIADPYNSTKDKLGGPVLVEWPIHSYLDECDAARRADRMAERFAESSREIAEKDRIEQEIEQLKTDTIALRNEARYLHLAEKVVGSDLRHNSQFYPFLRLYKNRMRAIRDEFQSNRRRLKKLGAS